MNVLSRKTKAKLGAKTVKQAAKHPKLALRGAHAVKEVRTVQKQTRTARTRVLPGVLVGIAIGAAGMYLLDSATGKSRRHRLTRHLGGSGEHPHEEGQGVEAGGPAHPAPGHLPPDSEPERQS